MFKWLLSFRTIANFSGSIVPNSKQPIKCVSLNHQPHQARPALVDLNSHDSLFYPFDPYAWVWVPNKVKNMNVKVINSMLGVNETKFLIQHESFECKCRLNESACNSKQKWNHDKCWCDCKELDDWSYCKKLFIYGILARVIANMWIWKGK